MKSRMRALPPFSNRGTTSTSTSRLTLVGAGAVGDEDAGQPAHARPDDHYRPADGIEDVHDVGGQRLDVIVGVRCAIAVTVAPGVQRHDVKPVVGQYLAGVLPGESVLAAAVQHQDRRPIASRRGSTRRRPA